MSMRNKVPTENLLNLNTEEVSTMLTDVLPPDVADHLVAQQMDGQLLYTLITTDDQFLTLDKMGLTARQILVFKSVYPNLTTDKPVPMTPCRAKVQNHIENMQQTTIRNQVARKWTGNSLPTFSKESQSNLEELTDFVKDLQKIPILTYLEEKTIRKKIVKIMSERRRAVRSGRDYEAPPKNASKPEKKARKKLDLGNNVTGDANTTANDGIDIQINSANKRKKSEEKTESSPNKKIRKSSMDPKEKKEYPKTPKQRKEKRKTSTQNDEDDRVDIFSQDLFGNQYKAIDPDETASLTSSPIKSLRNTPEKEKSDISDVGSPDYPPIPQQRKLQEESQDPFESMTQSLTEQYGVKDLSDEDLRNIAFFMTVMKPTLPEEPISKKDLLSTISKTDFKTSVRHSTDTIGTLFGGWLI
eukprot:TCONS_00039010-protein